MLDIINRYLHGFVAVPVIIACKEKGLFELLEHHGELTREQIVESLGANGGHLQVALRMMRSLNWLERNEVGQYSLKDEAQLHKKLPEEILDLYHLPIESYLMGEQSSGQLIGWISRSIQRWNVDDPIWADFLDGILVIPILKALHKQNLLVEDEQKPLFSQLSAPVRDQLYELFASKGWALKQEGRFCLTDVGRFIVEQALITGTIASYTPMLSRMTDVLFGDCQAVFRRDASGQESHVDRTTLNVVATGFQHEKYFADVEDIILSIFNQLPIEEQPKYVVDMGCGDGTLLKRVYETIQSKSARGKVLHQYPLCMIGVDYNEASITATVCTLGDIPHLVFQGDIGDPEQMIASLKSHGIHDPENILHIRSFKDHDRPFIPPQNLDTVQVRSLLPYQGVYVAASGDFIPPQIMVQSLVEHLERWSKVVSKQGLIIGEVHCLEPDVVNRFLDRSENLHFDAIQAFSMQHLVEADVFLMAAAQVGLFPKFEFSKRYPKTFPFTRITLNCFEKRPYRIRHPRLSDLDALVNLEAKCWPEQIRASSDEIRQRIERYPNGHCVLEMDSIVVGVIYSQRISSAEQLLNINYRKVSSLHTKTGSIIQLLAINILPEMQDRGLGDQLREFMLQLCTLKGGIERVVAVTLCKNYVSHAHIPIEEYIHQRNELGQLLDPILRFHSSSGATIKGIIPNYRPEDVDNLGNGVLIEYDIHNRFQFHCDKALKMESVPKQKIGLQENETLDNLIEECIRFVLGSHRRAAFARSRPLMEMGLDSLELLELRALMSQRLGVELEPTFFFQYGTCDAIARYFKGTEGEDIRTALPNLDEQENSGENNSDSNEIAIVGFACRLPGGIDNPEALWELLKSGGSVIEKLPEGRWQWPADIDPEGRYQGIDWGGFLSQIDRFDAGFFRISALEAQSMDPQQRILMELAWQTLENAGVTANKLAGSSTGVFVGASGSDYCRVMDRVGIAIEAHVGTGMSLAALANRISYFFDLRGPSIVVDTACSSSLMAVHQAVRSIRSGECLQALVGGVHIMCHPANSIAYYKAGMLAHDGKCKTFDDRANGYVRSEGAVMFLLKQLRQAEADGDLIHALIKGSASNHGGQSAGLTVPNPQQQAALLTDAWKAAGVNPSTISFIEAHGTGTALGDPIEIQGIQQAFSEWAETSQIAASCGLGALKTNLGHLEAAAGIAGLLKVVLSIRHQELPAIRNFGHLNHHIDLSGSPLYVVNQHQKWERPNESIPRRAGVSSFGSGGANVHVLVEEYDAGCRIENADKDRTSEPFLFVLSAQNAERLSDYVDRFQQWLSSLSDDQCPLAEVTRFLRNHRQALEERLAVVAASRVDLVNKLRQFPDLGESGFHGNIKHPSREMRTLIRGNLGDQITQAAIAGRDWEQLAALWVAGVSLDWCLLDGNQLPMASSSHWRFSIPTYPFVRNQFWLSDTTSLPDSAQLLQDRPKQIDASNPSVKIEQADEESASEAALFTLKLVWQPLDISKCCESEPKILDGKTVIIGGTSEQKPVLQTHLTRCESIAIGPNADVGDIVEQLQPLGRIASIIWLGTSDPIEQDFPENLLVNRAGGLLQFYRLLKAVVALGYRHEELQWTAIALQSQAVFCNEAPDPTQSAIHGFIGSIAKEFPQWRFRLLDMASPAATPDASYTWPVREIFALPFDSDVRSLAWRDGKWHRPILTKLFLEEPARSAYRAGGVYVVIGGAGGLGEVWSRYAIKKYRAQIVWIGRSPLNDSIQTKLEELAKLGPRPRYICADATSQQELQCAYEEIKREFGQVQGVVHAAVGLFDRSFNDTDEARFRAVLSAKIDVSVRLAQVFHTEDLDFVLFFSSIEALSQSGGLSGYAAGCAFKDAFAQCLASRWNCPVKVIHWGHWAIGTGARISEASKTRLKQRGIGLLESRESMQALECLVSNDRLNQLALIKSVCAEAIDWYDDGEFVVSFEEVAPSVMHEIRRIDVVPNQSLSQLQADCIFQCEHMQPLLVRLLRTSLNALNLHSSVGVPDFYAKWLAASRSILAKNEVGAGLESPDAIWQAWNKARDNWSETDSKQRAFSLVETCVRALPEILSGQKRSTDSLFPNGSLQVVEGIYRDNSVADYFNEVLAKSLRSAIEARLKHDRKGKLRILEIGAGTGATTKAVLSKLAGLENHISEYRYTDISRAFLLHAQEKLMPDYPFVQIGIFDVEQPLAGQKIEAGSYDFAIATNVLHATRNIRQTLRNAKACLRTNGLILLNELCEQTLFGHLTFGLLEGWWRHEDPELRIDGTPLLSVDSWERVLQTEGFQSPWFPVAKARSLGQQVIVAESDGLVRQSRTSVGKEATSRSVLNFSGEGRSRVGATGPLNEYDDASLRQKATRFFQELVAKILRMDPAQIEADEPFQNYGFDSILVTQLTGALREKFAGINSTLLFEVQTLGELVNYFAEHRRSDLIAQLSTAGESVAMPDTDAASRSKGAEAISATDTSRLATRPRSNTTDAIAIIGMSGRYPMAKDLPTFWERLKAGTDCISEIPRERWSWEDYFHPHVEEAVELGKSYCKWGSFLDDAKEFDAQFFGISPHEVVNMDPQERIFLQAAWEALEDAGHTKQMLESQYQQRVGVFVGVTRTGFDLYGPEWRQGKIGHPHTSFSSIANRLSYFLNIRGPSLPIDTMCSSSLTAVHEACQHIQNGSCKLAFAGGVNLYLHPSSYNKLCASRMLSKDGRCKSFGNHSNGFVPGEGVGVVLLKPLSQAIADQDIIYAVIRGTHVNHGGKTNGYTVPNPKAQAELVFEALEKSGVEAREVSYVEAHGTGTELGDPIEVAGLTMAFQRHTQDTRFCALGSVKSNVGHLEAASGIAGLTKAILQLRHKQLVPSLHADELNPNIDFDQTPFYVQRRLEPWRQPIVEAGGKTKTVPRIAGVSSFGAGGVNAHVVVEEYDEEPTGESEVGDAPVLVLLSARNNVRLAAYADKLRQFLEAGAVNLQNLAYTLQVGREALQSRIALIISSQSELITKLDAFIKGKSDIDDFYVGLAGKDKATVLNWNSDPDLLKQVTAWTEEGCYARLAELWVKGVTIDWSRLRRTSTICPRRISLPTYPFDRKRYWLELEGNDSSQVAPTVNTQAARTEESSKAIHLNDKQQTVVSPKTRKLITLVETDKVRRDGVNRRNRQPIRLSNPADLAPPTKVTSTFLSLSQQAQGIVEIRIAAAERPLDASRLSAELRDKMRSLALSDEVRVLLLVDDNGLFSSNITHNDVPVMRALIGFLLELELPVIALPKSDIRGLGWSLVSLCDFPIFRESGQFCHQGLTALERLIVEERFGKSFASRFFAVPHLCNGQALTEMGLDCPIAADERLDDLARELAQQLSQSPQRSLTELKKQLSRSVQSRIRQAYFPSIANTDAGLSSVSAVPAFFTHQDLERVEEKDQWLASPTFVDTYCDVVHVHAFLNGVVQVTLADTANKNTFSNAFSEGLTQAFEHIESVHTYKVVVLTGYNQYFACGGTKSGLQDIYNGRARFTDNDIHSLPLRCRLPVIAAMQGHAIGGGWSLGMFCDVPIFSEESIYQTPYMQYGFTPGAGSTLIFPARFGPNLSREILFTGREYKGAELKERGISMPVLPRSQVPGYALTLAHHLAKFSKDELVQRKAQATAGLRDSLDTVHTQELAMHEKTFVGQSQVLKNIHERFSQSIELPLDKQSNADVVHERNFSVIQTLREMIAAELFLETAEIDEDTKFVDMGLDSISAVMWIKRINAKFGLSLPATKVYSYPTLREFADYVQQSGNVLDGLNEQIATPEPMMTGDRLQGRDAQTPRPPEAQTIQRGIKGNRERATGNSEVLPGFDPNLAQPPIEVGTSASPRHLVEDCPPNPVPSNTELPSSPSILKVLTESIAQELFMEVSEIDEETKFVDMGMDSITAVTWMRKINHLFGCSLPATEVYKYPTLSDFVRHLGLIVARTQSNKGAVAVPPQTASAHLLEQSVPTPADSRAIAIRTNSYDSDAIAVIGMAGQFPRAKTLEEFWENIANGRNCVSEIASDRWKLADFYDPDKNAANKTYCKWMGALEDIDQFDPLFFNISPREAEFMDPQQRLFLQASWHCIEDAGYKPASFAGSKCGVFVGCETGDYGKIVQRYELNALGLLGGSAALLPARISYFLNLQGPCMAIDTACSASLVAIASACDSLLLGHSDAALAGGVYVLSGPEMHIMMSKAGILSPDGRCFTFDQRANGFVPGEGVGVVLLKRLADAQKDGDDICGVIRGWGVNQDGKTNGITAPNGQSQQRLQKEVYERFRIQPADIQLVEAHGTGTRLGDPIEVEALCETFREFTNKQKFCAIGSLKSNIGHLATAAGVAGVIKVLLAIRNKKLPPTINYESLNEHINLDRSPFYINTECKDWTVVDAEPRRAAINCFGFSGTNAHMVIEEYVNQADQRQAILTDVAPAQPYPIILSAKNEQRLLDYAEQLLKHLESETQPGKQSAALGYRLCDLAYTLQVGREPMDARLAFVADTLTEVAQKLRRFVERNASTPLKSFDGIYCGLVGSDSSDLIKFAADGDIVATTNSWLSQRKYSKVMELWVRGVSIDWTQIYSTGVTAPKRIRLPTYPFARERYWIDGVIEAIKDSSAKKSEFADRLDSDSQFEWTPEALAEDIPWSDRFTHYQDKRIIIVYASDQDKEGICSLLRRIEDSVGLTRSLNLQCLSFDALDTISLGQPSDVVLAVKAKDDAARNSFGILCEWLKSQQGLVDTYYLTVNTEGFADLDNDEATGAIATSLSNEHQNCRIIGVPKGISRVENYQVLLREWLSRNPLDEQPRESEWVRYDGAERFVLRRAKGKPVESGEKSKRPYSIQKKWKQRAVRRTETSSFQGEMLILVNEETADLGQQLFRRRQALIACCANNDSDRNRQISGHLLDFRDASSGLQSAEAILSQREPIRIVVDLSALYESPKDCDQDPLGKIAFYQRLIAACSDLDILYITNGLQHFRSDTVSLAGSKLAGLIKVLSAEHAYVRSRHIDIDAAMLRNPGLLEQALTQELTANLEDTEICYRQQERFVPYLEAELEEPTADFSIRSDGVYVISGGTGGIGLEIADYLVAKGARKLVLMGLNALPPKTKWENEREQHSEHLKVKLGKLARLDRQVEHLSVYTGSLTERQRLVNFFAEIRDKVGSLSGVIHSAGVGSDFKKPAFVAKDLAHIAAVLEPKMTGLETLATVFANDALDFFVAFSSLTGLIPRFAKGSCDYALANAYVDLFMAYQNTQLHKWGYKSITWVDWHETGMAARAPSCIFTAMQNNLDKIGLFTHSNEVGKALFERALQQKEAAWVLNTEIDPTKFGEASLTLLYPRDRSARDDEPTEVSSIQHQIEQWESQVENQGFIAPESVSNVISLEEIKRLDPQLVHRLYRLLFPQTTAQAFDNDSHEAIALNAANDPKRDKQDAPAINVIREVTSQVLKLKGIDDNRKFQDYGLDSISATQLAIRLEKRLQQEVQPQWLIDFPTVRLLTDCLQRQPVALAVRGESIANVLQKAVMDVLKLSNIDHNQSFQNYGLDSISATQLAIKLEKQLEREIPPQWLIDYPTITSLARHLSTQK